MAVGPGPFCMAIFASTLREGVKLVDDLYLGDNLVQFEPDTQTRGGYWVILRVTGDQKRAICERGEHQRPRWTIL